MQIFPYFPTFIFTIFFLFPLASQENPLYKDFEVIFQKFDLAAIREAELAAEAAEGAEAVAEAAKEAAEAAEANGDEDEDGDKALSKRKKKLARRMKVAELKQVSAQPS